MTDATIQRYQTGGDIYQTLLSQYGKAGADQIAAAAATGSEAAVQTALENVRQNYGIVTGQKTTSTTAIFASELVTDPLGAPSQWASGVVSKSINAVGNVVKAAAGSAVKNWGIWLIGLAVIIVIFIWAGGPELIRAIVRRKAKTA